MDVEKREVHTTATTLAWDELVFATGSTPFVPPIPGGDAPHVFTFRTLADIRAIQENTGPAVVLGGGVLGVEVAAALARSCDNVTLVHRGAWLMEQQLDRQAGVLLEEVLAERGVRCELSSGVTAIAADAVTLQNGRKINASRVVLATGVQPNVALAKASGIHCARGIVVNHQMQTSVPAISAIGECCEIDGQTFGLVAPCLAQADILAARLAGEASTPFALTDSGMRLKVPGVELFSAGRVEVLPDDVVWSAWGSADPSLSPFVTASRCACWRAADGGLPQRGNIHRFTGNGCARPRGLAVQSIHYATAGCRTKRYDKTYAGGGWTRYGRPSFSRRRCEAQFAPAVPDYRFWRRALCRLRLCAFVRVFWRTKRRIALTGGR